MAIPSGGGSEVLKRFFIHANNGAWTNLITGEANHIYTIISVTFCDQTGTAEDIRLRVDTNASGSDHIVIFGNGQSNLPANETFVWNDKFVLTGTDKLDAYSSSGNVDIYCSYIEQDWS